VQTILVVDDEFGVVEVLVASLEDEGYRVVVAANGRHGLEQLSEHQPDLVIVDYMMPLMNGADMVRQMRANGAGRTTPVIFMSAVAEGTVRETQLDYAGFLRKPFRSTTLVEMVKKVLKPAGEPAEPESRPQ
jgi:CheY-like chemotaxis protein